MPTAQSQMEMFQEDLLNSILGHVLPSGEHGSDRPADEVSSVEEVEAEEVE